jgi:hypothetical protein
MSGERSRDFPAFLLWKGSTDKADLPLSASIVCCIVIISAIVEMTLLLLLYGAIFCEHVAYAHHIIDQKPIPSRPMGLSFSAATSSSSFSSSTSPTVNNSQLLYVSNFGLPIVSIINTTSNKLIGNINIQSKTGVMTVESIPQQNKLYVAPFEGAVLEVYNSHTKNLTKIIPLPNSKTVLALDHFPSPRPSGPTTYIIHK